MTSRFLFTLAVALAACKTRGTIEIGFTLGDAGADGPSIDECVETAHHSLLYAQPNVSCPCACGSCFGAKPNGVNACDDEPDQFCAPSLQDAALDLSPGHWAVVLALFDETGRELASGCVEIDVDADGDTSPARVDGRIYCATACPEP